MTDRVPFGRNVTGEYYYVVMQKLRRKMHKNITELLVAGHSFSMTVLAYTS